VKYKILIDKKAAEHLAGLPAKIQRQISRKIDTLAQNPYPANCVKIRNTKDIFRIRSGDYRITYQVQKKKVIIFVVRIGHRKDFYSYYSH